MADTGNGATITFGTTGFTGEIISIGGNEASLEALDTSHLGTTGNMTKAPADLVDQGDFSIEFFFDPDTQPTIGTVETITVTFPVPSGGLTGATLAGTGFINSFKWGPLENNSLMRGTAGITWSGVTGPSWSAST